MWSAWNKTTLKFFACTTEDARIIPRYINFRCTMRLHTVADGTVEMRIKHCRRMNEKLPKHTHAHIKLAPFSLCRFRWIARVTLNKLTKNFSFSFWGFGLLFHYFAVDAGNLASTLQRRQKEDKNKSEKKRHHHIDDWQYLRERKAFE